MLAEINKAKEFLIEKFGSIEEVKAGTYAIPTETSRGKAFMKVVIGSDMSISDFHLFKDEELTISWYE